MNRTNEKNRELKRTQQNSAPNIRWMLVGYDLIVYAVVAIILLVIYGGMDKLSSTGILQQVCLSALCIFAARLLGKIYEQVWRYGGIQCYIRLLFTDSIAFIVYLCLELMLPVQKITFARMLSLASLNLLGALALRMMYRYAYKCGNRKTVGGKILSILLRLFSGMEAGNEKEVQKIKVAIIGAGRVGVGLAEDLLNNAEAAYIPRGFIDVNKEKVGREIHGIPVWSEDEATFQKLGEFEVQEIIFAIPSMDADKKKALYEYYKNAGYKLKVYDYPTMYAAGGKRHLREFDIEELLFRKPLVVSDERTNAYYKDKVVLITGGGGSIGSELCRQLAKMNPKKIIILDIYENGAYDVQQELKIAYGNKLDLQIEICSITHRKALEKVSEKYVDEFRRNQNWLTFGFHCYDENLTYDYLHSSEENLWSILYLTGYLTKAQEDSQNSLEKERTALIIPNLEVKEIYQNTILKWFDDSVKGWERKKLFQAVWDRNEESLSAEMTKLLRKTISYHDYKEDFYHAFLAGIFAGAGYVVESNKEHGEGRSDIVIYDDYEGKVAIFEAKKSQNPEDMILDCEKAIKQINEKMYANEFEDAYDEILCYGISFFKKRCLVKKK